MKSRALRRVSGYVRALMMAVIGLSFVLQMTTGALAGTTGIISGTVADQETHAPIANVRVTAASPSGTYSAVSDSRGFFSMAGVYPDTYAVSFQATNYAPASEPGVVVFADQVATVNFSLTKQLRTIAKVTARSAGGAYQPSQTVDTYTVTSQQANQILGNNLNTSESQLIASLPGAGYDSSGYPVIRGGRENEESFQFEGIPYTDAFTNQFVNTLSLPGLGLQSAQLTPGVSNASFSTQGTGTLNLIVKRGTYPGFATAQVAVGGPSFRHELNLEWGWATQDGRWSDYAAYNGRNLAPHYLYPSLEIGRFASLQMETDREFVNNLVFRFGKSNNQSLQLFTDIADHHFYEGYGGYGKVCFTSCNPYFLYYGRLYGMSAANLQSITPFSPGQISPTETLAQANRNWYTGYQPNESGKLQYTWNINPSTYLSVMGYHVNAVTTFDEPAASFSNPFGSDHTSLQGGITDGGKIDLTKQLSEKHLLKVGGEYKWLHPVFDDPGTTYAFWNGAFSNGEPWDYLPCGTLDSNGFCTGPGSGYLAANGIPAGTKLPYAYENTNSNRQDFGVYVNDTWTPNDRWHIDLGARIDGSNYKLAIAPGMDANCFFYYLPSDITAPNASSGIRTPGDCGTAKFNVTKAETNPRILQPVLAVSYKLGNNDSVRASYGRSVEFPTLGAVDWSVTPGYYYNTPYAKIPSFSFYGWDGNPSDYSQAPAVNCGLFQDTLCHSYADQLYWNNVALYSGMPFQPVKPEVFTNYDFSYSHQFTGGLLNGVQLKITPWYRNVQDAFASAETPKVVNGQVVTNPLTGAVLYNPSVQSNLGYSRANGVEMDITREVAYGLSGQFTATYQNEWSNVVPLSGSEDFYPSVPAASLALGNRYRVGFLSPFQTTLALDYHTHNGWRFSPQFFYDIGYPYGAGLIGPAFVDGKAYNIPNTNASAGLIGSPAGAVQYIDPMNPGSFFNPNIAATRGTPEQNNPGGMLSHPDLTANFTTEYELPNHQITLGATVLNVFNQVYGGPSLNGRYQPVATGISGPKSGSSSTTQLFGPDYGMVNYSALRSPFMPYINTPSGSGRTFYFYVTTKI